MECEERLDPVELKRTVTKDSSAGGSDGKDVHDALLDDASAGNGGVGRLLRAVPVHQAPEEGNSSAWRSKWHVLQYPAASPASIVQGHGPEVARDKFRA